MMEDWEEEERKEDMFFQGEMERMMAQMIEEGSDEEEWVISHKVEGSDEMELTIVNQVRVDSDGMDLEIPQQAEGSDVVMYTSSRDEIEKAEA